MKKVSYSKDVDALLIEISNDAIAYAEEDGQVILHYSPDDKLVLVEILDFRRFMSKESVAAMLAAWSFFQESIDTIAQSSTKKAIV
jgi:hypothetical protein